MFKNLILNKEVYFIDFIIIQFNNKILLCTRQIGKVVLNIKLKLKVRCLNSLLDKV